MPPLKQTGARYYGFLRTDASIDQRRPPPPVEESGFVPHYPTAAGVWRTSAIVNTETRRNGGIIIASDPKRYLGWSEVDTPRTARYWPEGPMVRKLAAGASKISNHRSRRWEIRALTTEAPHCSRAGWRPICIKTNDARRRSVAGSAAAASSRRIATSVPV